MTSEMASISVEKIEDLLVSSFSEEQIELYHAKKKRAAYEKKQLILLKRQKRRAKYELLSSVIIVLLTGSLFFYGVYLTTEASAHSRRIAVMQNELRDQIRENDDMKKRIDDSVNLLSVKDQAIALGFGYPDERSIVYYDLPDCDYMTICTQQNI